jgi:hypothetical protein
MYAGFLCWNIFDGTRSQIKHHEPAWYIALDLLLSVVIVAVFAGYWVGPIMQAAPRLAPYLFAASWVWVLCAAPHEIRRVIASFGSEVEKRLYIRFGFWLEPVLLIPALWFGGKAALRAL